MKNAIQKAPFQWRKKINPSYLSGLRLFHVFSIETMVQMAEDNGLKVCEDITFNGQKMNQAVFTYYSGKEIPTAAIIFQKK